MSAQDTPNFLWIACNQRDEKFVETSSVKINLDPRNLDICLFSLLWEDSYQAMTQIRDVLWGLRLDITENGLICKPTCHPFRVNISIRLVRYGCYRSATDDWWCTNLSWCWTLQVVQFIVGQAAHEPFGTLNAGPTDCIIDAAEITRLPYSIMHDSNQFLHKSITSMMRSQFDRCLLRHRNSSIKRKINDHSATTADRRSGTRCARDF